MKTKLENQFKYSVIILTVLLLFVNCEDREIMDVPVDAQEIEIPIEDAGPRATYVSGNEIPEIVRALALRTNSSGGKGGDLSAKISYNNANIYLDSIMTVVNEGENTNYTFNLLLDGIPENQFYNLVVGKTPDGALTEPYVIGYEMDPDDLDAFLGSDGDFRNFRANYRYYTFDSFFADSEQGMVGKTGDCGGGTIGGGGGGTVTPPGGRITNTAFGSTATAHFGPRTSSINYYYHYSLTLTQNGQVNTVETVATSGIVTVDPVDGISAPTSINISTSTVWAGTTVSTGGGTGGGSSPCSIRHSTLNDNGIGFTVVCPFLPHTNKSMVSGKSGDCPDGGGGVGISPLLAKKTLGKVRVELGLTAEEFNWLAANLNTALPIKDFLEREAYSEEAKNEAKMRVSFGISLSQNGLKPASGKLGGVDALEYTHKDTGYDGGKGTLYKLKSGLFISSYNSRRSINKSDEFNSEPSLSFDGNFYYANDGDTDKWYEVLISKGVGGAPNGVHVLIDAFWTSARFVGRYALPVEDAMILVDGKDWDGVEQSRVRTAGFLLVGFVPGGKAMQPVAKIAKSTTAWAVIVKWSNKSVKLKYKLVQGTVDFGDRAKLGRLLGTTSDIEAHHIIPWVKGGQHKVVQDAARAGFHLNMIENGLGLQKYTKLIGAGLHGNHPAYDIYVIQKLNFFSKKNINYTPEQANNFIRNILIPDLKEKIILAKNSGMNLNDYFKSIL